MSRQRLRAIQRQIDKIVSGSAPRTREQRAHEYLEVHSLINELGAILLSRLESKPERTTTEKALYYYLSGTVRR